MLGEIIGIKDFAGKVKGLSSTHLVQSGAELAYLFAAQLPEFRGVRREHLVEAGKRVRLKENVKLLAEILAGELGEARFQFVVISAGPRQVVQSALEGIVPPENVYGTEFGYDSSGAEITSVERVPAGYGKVVSSGTRTEIRDSARPNHLYRRR